MGMGLPKVFPKRVPQVWVRCPNPDTVHKLHPLTAVHGYARFADKVSILINTLTAEDSCLQLVRELIKILNFSSRATMSTTTMTTTTRQHVTTTTTSDGMGWAGGASTSQPKGTSSSPQFVQR